MSLMQGRKAVYYPKDAARCYAALRNTFTSPRLYRSELLRLPVAKIILSMILFVATERLLPFHEGSIVSV